MTSHLERSPNRTPDRHPLQDSNSLLYSATVDRPSLPHLSHHSNTPFASFIPSERSRSDRLSFLENRLSELRNYLNESPNIEKQPIRQLFNWQEDLVRGQDKEQKFLKELSSRVKGLIKENNQLRQNCHTEQLYRLKRQNARLQELIEGVQRGEAAREGILSQQNQYLRDYIGRKKDISLSEPKNTLSHSIYTPNKTSQISFGLLQSSPNPQNVKSLKQHIGNIIKEVIQSNDEKLQAQQRYVDSLQKRLTHLQGVEQKLDHFRFEKTVKLTQSVRKSKNFSVGAPKVKGQDDQAACLQPEHQQKLIEQKSSPTKKVGAISRKLFSDKLYTTEKISDLSHQIRIQQLEEQNRNLQQKYIIEIENHINDTADRQEILNQLQQTQAERRELQRKYDQLKDQQQLYFEKIKDLETFIARQQRGNSSVLPSSDIGIELKQIRETLQSFDQTHYTQIEAQITCLLLERNSLKRELTALQQSTTNSSKFSAIHKQIFFLKEKNAQLEQNCQFYEKQLQDYEAQLQQLRQEGEQTLARNISSQIRAMWQEKQQEFEGLKWQRELHHCVVNSVNRMIQLEQALGSKS